MDPHPVAILFHRALTANRRDGPAEVLTKANQEVVVFNPIFFWQFFPQGKLGLLRVFRFHISPTIGDAMDVGVHANSRFAKTQGHNEVSGLPTHTLKFK